MVSAGCRVTGPLIKDEKYWERCCHARWSLCVVADYGGSWKRMYFERHLQHELETFVPQQSDEKQVIKVLCLHPMFRLLCPFPA